MKKIMFSVLLIVIAVLSAGCSNIKDAALPMGNYCQEGEVSFLRIAIEAEQKFTFTHMALSSWPPKGNYIIENERVTLVIDDENKYVFDIKGNSLIYNAALSSILKGAYIAYEDLEDGTKFTLSGE